jgi:type VI protein secretion system component Hcp
MVDVKREINREFFLSNAITCPCDKVCPNHLYHQSHRNLQYTNTNEKRSNTTRFTFRPTIDMASPYISQTSTTQRKSQKILLAYRPNLPAVSGKQTAAV